MEIDAAQSARRESDPDSAARQETEEALNSLVGKGLLRPSKRKPISVKRALKIRNVRIAEAVLEDRAALL